MLDIRVAQTMEIQIWNSDFLQHFLIMILKCPGLHGRVYFIVQDVCVLSFMRKLSQIFYEKSGQRDQPVGGSALWMGNQELCSRIPASIRGVQTLNCLVDIQ